MGVEQIVWDTLYSEIKNPYGVAALMGNIKAESGMCSNKVDMVFINLSKSKGIFYTDKSYTNDVDTGKITREKFLNPYPGKQYGYGLCQWTFPSRKAGLYDLVKKRGVSISDVETQMIWLMSELKISYKDVWHSLVSATNVKNASDIVLKKFEEPHDTSESVCKLRASYGEEYYNMNVNTSKNTYEAELDKLISIAKEEVGYLEKKSNSNLDSKEGNAGSANYTKYWRDMANLGLGNYQTGYWCACFVAWCFYKAYGLENMQKLLLQKFFINCQTMYDIAKSKNRIFTQPNVGDVVLFYKNGEYAHTGIVTGVTSDGFTTIEGNTNAGYTVVQNGGGVAIKVYKTANLPKVAFMRPDYQNILKTTNAVTAKKLNTEEKFKAYVDGVNSLSVYSYAGKNYGKCSFSPLKKGIKVAVCDTIKGEDGINYYYIKWNGKYGFVKKKYISRTKNFNTFPCMVKVKVEILTIRSGPGSKYDLNGEIRDKGVYTITEKKNDWGKLKSGAGWIYLPRTKLLK